MNGYDIYKKVCALLGYYNLGENESNAKSTAFCSIINQIAEDLQIPEISGLSDELILTPRKKEALIYGSAMLFAVSLSDGGCAKMYSELYNSKRSKALSQKDMRYDVLPSPSSGGM